MLLPLFADWQDRKSSVTREHLIRTQRAFCLFCSELQRKHRILIPQSWQVIHHLASKTTDTLDIWGTVTGECESSVTEEQLRRVIPNFTGEIEQIPPMQPYKRTVKGFHNFARQGIEVERKSRKVTVYSLSLANFDEKAQTGTLEISCSKGTYVRTIIDDIGRVLGVGAVMTALCRTLACGFSLDECITLDELKSICENGNVEENCVPLRACLWVWAILPYRLHRQNDLQTALSADRTYILPSRGTRTVSFSEWKPMMVILGHRHCPKAFVL